MLNMAVEYNEFHQAVSAGDFRVEHFLEKNYILRIFRQFFNFLGSLILFILFFFYLCILSRFYIYYNYAADGR